MRPNYAGETDNTIFFDVRPPLSERQRDADDNFLPDPSLPEPYPGYSMMEMLRREGAGTHPMVQPKPIQIKPINGQTRITKGKKKKRSKASQGKY